MDWQLACLERERSFRVWSQPDEHMEHFTFNDYLFAAVDVVHLMQVCGNPHGYFVLPLQGEKFMLV